MKHVFRWLNPKTGLRGLAFGLLFGFVWGCVLFISLELRHPTFELTPHSLEKCLRISFALAIPWALIWGGSGLACSQIPGHPGTLSTLFTVACVTAHYLHNYTVGGWMPLVIIFHTVIAIIPCHMLGYIVATLFGRVRDPEEAA